MGQYVVVVRSIVLVAFLLLFHIIATASLILNVNDDDEFIAADDGKYFPRSWCNYYWCVDGWPMWASFVSTVVCYSSPGAKMMLLVMVAQTVSTVNVPDQFSQQLHDVLHALHILLVHPAININCYEKKNVSKICSKIEFKKIH